MGSEGRADERSEFIRGDIGVVEGHDVGLDLLAELAVIDPEYDDLADGRVFVEPVLDLDRIDVLATADDEIGAAACKEEQSVLDAAEVAGSEPAARSDRLGGRLRVVPVARCDHRAAQHHVANLAVGERVVVVVVDRKVACRDRRTDRLRIFPEHVVARRGGEARTLGQAVPDAHGPFGVGERLTARPQKLR